MIKFKKADEYTIGVFNPHGLKNYEAVQMVTTSKNEGFAPYDLSILQAHTSGFYVAHGSKVETINFESCKAAKQWIVQWYFDNRQKMYIGAAK